MSSVHVSKAEVKGSADPKVKDLEFANHKVDNDSTLTDITADFQTVDVSYKDSTTPTRTYRATAFVKFNEKVDVTFTGGGPGGGTILRLSDLTGNTAAFKYD